jgi:hypothetical protein
MSTFGSIQLEQGESGVASIGNCTLKQAMNMVSNKSYRNLSFAAQPYNWRWIQILGFSQTQFPIITSCTETYDELKLVQQRIKQLLESRWSFLRSPLPLSSLSSLETLTSCSKNQSKQNNNKRKRSLSHADSIDLIDLS